MNIDERQKRTLLGSDETAPSQQLHITDKRPRLEGDGVTDETIMQHPKVQEILRKLENMERLNKSLESDVSLFRTQYTAASNAAASAIQESKAYMEDNVRLKRALDAGLRAKDAFHEIHLATLKKQVEGMEGKVTFWQGKAQATDMIALRGQTTELEDLRAKCRTHRQQAAHDTLQLETLYARVSDLKDENHRLRVIVERSVRAAASLEPTDGETDAQSQSSSSSPPGSTYMQQLRQQGEAQSSDQDTDSQPDLERAVRDLMQVKHGVIPELEEFEVGLPKSHLAESVLALPLSPKLSAFGEGELMRAVSPVLSDMSDITIPQSTGFEPASLAVVPEPSVGSRAI